MNKLKTLITNICRLAVALIFIFSGFVKAIDPLGTQYKIQDYLEAISMNGVIPDWITLFTSTALAALEFCLGIFLLFAIRRRLISKITSEFMAIMTIITLWLVICNPVNDCGCFGDAIHLTNMQTFIKNIVLLACSITLAIWPLRMIRFISRSNQWIAVNYTIVFIFVVSAYCLYKLPLFDFRPYHIGTNIKKGMEIPEGAPQPKFETTFIMQKNGQRKEFTLNNYPDSTWTFIDSKTIQTKAGYVPPIHDFSIQTAEGKDITDDILTHKGYTFLLISPNLTFADDSDFGTIDQIYEYARDNKYDFYCLTASTDKQMQHWRDITGAEYPFCITDETTLKTVIRSNPGLLLIKDGTIIGKWSHNDLPQPETLNAPLQKLSIGHMPDNNIPGRITKILLWFFLPLFLLSLADRIWAWSNWIKKKENENKLFKFLNIKTKL